jgi:hypothetical protein
VTIEDVKLGGRTVITSIGGSLVECGGSIKNPVLIAANGGRISVDEIIGEPVESTSSGGVIAIHSRKQN